MPFTITCPVVRPTLASGSSDSNAVKTMQQAVNARLGVLGAPGNLLLVVDGNYGPKTTKAVKYIQCVAFLSADGIVGPITWAYLCNGEISLPKLSQGSVNEPMIREIQRILKFDSFYTGAIDGDFGPLTKAAVKAYQQTKSLFPDGIVGPLTWQSLVLRKVSGGSCNV